MINILYLHAGAEMYGADKILLELVTGINKKKFHPIVILPSDGILKERLLKNNIETYVVHYPILRRKYFNFRGIFNYVFKYFAFSKKILKLLKDKNIDIDIIHVNTTAVLEGIYLKKKIKCRLLWHVHEIILKPKFVYEFLCLLIGHYSDQCIAVSNAVRNHLTNSKIISSKKISVIYNGVNSNKFSPHINYEYLFDEFKINRNSIRIGMIGRVNSWKGQDIFIDSLEPLMNQYSNLYIFIIGSAFVGEEWRVEKLKNKIKSKRNSKRIFYSPYRTDSAAFHNFFDIFVLPSTNPDPLPTVVLEAMSCGKPVVGFAHGGITEMVVDGYNGFLVKPCSKITLQNKINELISQESLLRKMGENSKKRSQEMFSMNEFLLNFQNQYISLIK